MPLPNGTRIGNYEILGPLGSGGMGEVYRARDTRLDRVVAIKSLPPGFAQDVERLARFEREAKLLASLAHPNIATIYGLEESEGAPYIVLEFIEGESLAQRLFRGPLAAQETLEAACQIASAIEAAHERGVVHRDLKPGNIMLTPQRAVKVLDFGLAKGSAATGPSQDPSSTPTGALTATAEGIILGTTPYMSPEQARGKAVDRRTDIWSFGCVLFECLSGRQAFAGETTTDVIAKILEREPDWGSIPAATPPKLRDLIRRCLTKNPDERPRDIGDLRRELTTLVTESSSRGLSSSGAQPAAAAVLPSLAVLYFENISSDPESEYFCAGITEDILTDLSKIKGMRVASRNAVARYRGAPADIPKIAAELNVNAVLEGSVRRLGDRVRITAQLINPADGFHIWAERYDRTLQDVFAVQEEIARAIASALRVALTPADAEKIGHDRPEDVRAYDLYLKGREYYGRYTPESIHYALELFTQATVLDPAYALAFAGIADCYGQMLQWGFAAEPGEATRIGLEAARRAIALNPRLPQGHKAEALVLKFTGNREGCRTSLIRAIDADPRYSPALINLAVESFAGAEIAASERLIRRALEADPQDAFGTMWLGFILMITGRYEAAMASNDRVRRLSSDPFYVAHAHAGRALLHVQRGDMAAAERDVREALADGVGGSTMRTVEAMLAAYSGRVEEARRLIVEVESATGLGSGTLMMAAGTALYIGEPEKAVRFMTRTLIGNLAPVLVRLAPELHALLDLEPFAPRRWDTTLVWPLEAPAVDDARRQLFKDVRVESGLPKGSDLLSG
jgi:serine/threonine protein kinase